MERRRSPGFRLIFRNAASRTRRGIGEQRVSTLRGFTFYEVAASGSESHSVGLRHTARHRSHPPFARRTFTDYAREMPPETSCRLGSLNRLTPGVLLCLEIVITNIFAPC